MIRSENRTSGRARGVRALLLACALGLVLGACEGSNIFKPCDPDGTTPHTPCPPEPEQTV
jgi:hypothetical protein